MHAKSHVKMWANKGQILWAYSNLVGQVLAPSCPQSLIQPTISDSTDACQLPKTGYQTHILPIHSIIPEDNQTPFVELGSPFSQARSNQTHPSQNPYIGLDRLDILVPSATCTPLARPSTYALQTLSSTLHAKKKDFKKH